MSRTPVLDLIAVEIRRPSGYFTLGDSELAPDGASSPPYDGLPATEADGYAWQALEAKALSVDIPRGGRRDTIGTSIEAGVATVVLQDAGDPTVDTYVKPSRPVRIRRKPLSAEDNPSRLVLSQNFTDAGTSGWTAAPAWTQNGTTVTPTISRDATRGRTAPGSLGIALSTWNWGDGSVGDPIVARRAFTGLQVGRRYRVAAWASAPSGGTTRRLGIQLAGAARALGAVLPSTGWAEVTLEFTATDTSHTVNIVGQRTSVAGGAIGLLVDDLTLTALPELDEGDDLFTGAVLNVQMRIQRDLSRPLAPPRRIITLTMTDTVQKVANTPRYGAANPSAEWEAWELRAGRVLQSLAVPYVLPDAPPALVDLGTGSYGGFVPTTERAAWGVSGSGSTWDLATTPGYRTFTGLTPGEKYRIQVNHFMPSEAEDPVVLGSTELGQFVSKPGSAGRTGTELALEFTATAPSVSVSLSGPNGGYLLRVLVTTLSRVLIANNVYESTVASHLDLITASARTGWYVDRHGVLRFPPTIPGVARAFFRDTSVPDVRHFPYVDATVAYGTSNLVNQLSMTNHKRKLDTEGKWAADDVTEGPFLDITNAATWGERDGKLEVGIAEPPGVYATSVQQLADYVLEVYGTPAVEVETVRVMASSNFLLASRLDVYDVVEARYASIVTQAQIVNLKHTITPEGWWVDYTLTRKGTI